MVQDRIAVDGRERLPSHGRRVGFFRRHSLIFAAALFPGVHTQPNDDHPAHGNQKEGDERPQCLLDRTVSPGDRRNLVGKAGTVMEGYSSPVFIGAIETFQVGRLLAETMGILVREKLGVNTTVPGQGSDLMTDSSVLPYSHMHCDWFPNIVTGAECAEAYKTVCEQDKNSAGCLAWLHGKNDITLDVPNVALGYFKAFEDIELVLSGVPEIASTLNFPYDTGVGLTEEFISEGVAKNLHLAWWEQWNAERHPDIVTVGDTFGVIISKLEGLITGGKYPGLNFLGNSPVADPYVRKLAEHWAHLDPDMYKVENGYYLFNLQPLNSGLGFPNGEVLMLTKKLREIYVKDPTTGLYPDPVCNFFLSLLGGYVAEFSQLQYAWGMTLCTVAVTNQEGYRAYLLTKPRHFFYTRTPNNQWLKGIAFEPVQSSAPNMTEVRMEKYTAFPLGYLPYKTIGPKLKPELTDLGGAVGYLVTTFTAYESDVGNMFASYNDCEDQYKVDNSVSTCDSACEAQCNHKAACDWVKDPANEPTWSSWLVTVCQPGFGASAENNCEMCAPGTAGAGGVEMCKPCPEGMFQPEAGQGSCIAASKGHFVSVTGATQQTKCGPGSITSTIGQRTCQPCEEGSFQSAEASSICNLTGPGEYQDEKGATAAKQCVPGTHTDKAGQSSCAACPVGFYGTADTVAMSSCIPAEVGYYVDAPASTSQTKCSVDESETTLIQGANAPTFCVCSEGYYAEPLSAGGMQHHQHHQHQQHKQMICRLCQDGMICPVGTVIPGVPEGFYLLHKDNITVEYPFGYETLVDDKSAVIDPLKWEGKIFLYECPPGSKSSCIGAPAVVVVQSDGVADGFDYPDQCGIGHRQSSLVCAACYTGPDEVSGKAIAYYPDQGSCKVCADGDFWPFVVFIIAGFSVLTSYYYLCNSETTRNASALMTTAFAFGIMITSLQTLSVVGTMTAKFTEPYASVMRLLSVFALDIEVIRSDCLFPTSSLTRFAMRIFIPFVVIAFYEVMYVIWFGPAVQDGKHAWSLGLFHRFFGPKHDKVGCINTEEELNQFRSAADGKANGFRFFTWTQDKVFNSIGQVFNALFITIVLSTLLPFQCFNQPDETQIVLAYPDVHCSYDDEIYPGLVGVGLAGLFLYGLTFASVCIWAVWDAPKRSQQDSSFLVRFKFLFARFRGDRYYWSLVLVTRSLCMATVPILFVNDGLIQMVAATLVLLVMLVVTVAYMPWKNLLLNLCDIFVMSVLIIIISLSGGFLETSKKTNGELYSSLALVLFLLLGTFLFLVIGSGIMESLRYGGKETDKVVEARITARLRHRTRTTGILGQRSAGKDDHNMDFQSHLKTFLTYIRGSQDWKPLAATDDKDDIDPNSMQLTPVMTRFVGDLNDFEFGVLAQALDVFLYHEIFARHGDWVGATCVSGRLNLKSTFSVNTIESQVEEKEANEDAVVQRDI